MMESVLEKLYESPNSIVFKKEDNGKSMAIKVLKAAHAHPRSILQFNNEFSILVELDIPGVKKVISKEMIQGSPGIVSFYFDGITLSEFISTKPFDLAERLEIA